MDTKLFPLKLKTLRLSKKLTLTELAKNIGITKQALSLYENGSREPGLYTLVKLAEYFNVNIDFFITEQLNINESLLEINPDLLKDDIHNLKKLISNMENTLISYKQILSNLESTINSIYNNSCNEELASEISPEAIDWQKYKHRKKNINYRTIPLLGDISAGTPCYAEGNIIDLIPIPEPLLSPYKEYYILNIKGDSMNKLFTNEEPILIEYTNYVSSYSIAIVRVGNDDATIKKVVLDGNYISLIPMSTNNIHKSKTYNIKDVCIQGKVVGKLSDILNTSL